MHAPAAEMLLVSDIGVIGPAMSDNEHRQIARDSLFVMADLRIDGVEGEHRIRVRNLSAGGLMAEGALNVQRGQVIWINVRGIGWVEGWVAWMQESRVGIAFREEIDPRIARAPVVAGESTPRYVKPPLGGQDANALRKI
jgi:PilZ domain